MPHGTGCGTIRKIDIASICTPNRTRGNVDRAAAGGNTFMLGKAVYDLRWRKAEADRGWSHRAREVVRIG